jgi:hypothetical protein
MLAIAQGFADRCDGIVSFLDIMAATINVAKLDHKRIKSRTSFVSSSKKLKAIVLKNQNFHLTAYDGAFLTLCAEFEMSIRKLIDKFVLDASNRCNEYHHLPPAMREWYPDGCSNLILGINQDKFAHLTKDQIMRSLASCLKTKNYNLVGEAFSDNQKNFRPEVVEETLSIRIGLSKIWQKLSRDAALQLLVGTTALSTVERQLKDRLGKIMQRRNDIIHRGRSYFTPSDTEVRESANFLKPLVHGLASVMKNYLDGI